LLPPIRSSARSVEQRSETAAAERVAHVVSHDRRRRGDGDHERELEPSPRGQCSCHDQRGLPRYERSGRFRGDERKQKRVTDVRRDVDERGGDQAVSTS
jgi:hypothetical protein